MNKEKLKFKLELWADYWDRVPVVEILINDQSHYKKPINGIEKEPTIIEFEHEVTEGEKFSLVIERLGKDRRQTVVEDGKIIKDQLLHIKTIEIEFPVRTRRSFKP